jgi:hypothetical protein
MRHTITLNEDAYVKLKNDREYARNRIEMIRIRLKNKFDNAHVIYLGENKHRVYKKSTEEDLMAS